MSKARWLARVVLALLFLTEARPQSAQFLPEIDTYVSLNTNVRFAFQPKRD